MKRMLLGIDPCITEPISDDCKKWKFHFDSDRQQAIPPSQNTFYKFLHAINKTNQNNMLPAVSTEGERLSGCWLIFKPLREVDKAWETVKKATEAGQLGYMSNVRTIKDHGINLSPLSKANVISVCTYNAFEVDDVMRVRAALQRLGFTSAKGKLEYKTLGATHEEIHYEDHDSEHVSIRRDFRLVKAV